MAIDYLGHLRTESARFLEVLRGADPAAPVPTCPDWDVADLLWHLTEVQAFWSLIVSERAQSPDTVTKPERAETYDGQLAAFAEWSDRLVEALAETSDDVAVWTWSDDHSVRFIRRRQAHEALIHRLDAEHAAGRVTPLPAPLAADGVVEVLDVMYGLEGACPAWGTFTPDGGEVRVRCTDTGHVFDVALGRFTGTDPEDGVTYDQAVTYLGAISSEPRASVSGPAGDLDAWLWHRGGDEGLVFEGQAETLATLREILSQPID